MKKSALSIIIIVLLGVVMLVTCPKEKDHKNAICLAINKAVDEKLGDNSLFSENSDGKRLITAFADAFFPVLESRLSKLAANKQAKQAKPTVRPEVVGKYLSTPIAGLTQPYGSGIPDVSGLTSEQKKALALQLLS